MTAEQLGRVLDYLVTYGWEPWVNGWSRTRGNSIGSAIQHALTPSMVTYCTVRNAIADYVNGDDEGWLREADTTIGLEKAADLILWEEGQTVETVLDALQEMVLLAEAVPAEPPVDWEEVWYE